MNPKKSILIISGILLLCIFAGCVLAIMLKQKERTMDPLNEGISALSTSERSSQKCENVEKEETGESDDVKENAASIDTTPVVTQPLVVETTDSLPPTTEPFAILPSVENETPIG